MVRSTVLLRDGRELGAESVVDFREKSYSEEIDTVSVVIDTLGREKEGSARILKKTKGAAYLSLQPKILEVTTNSVGLFPGQSGSALWDPSLKPRRHERVVLIIDRTTAR